jgi:hypothetical protein
VRQRAPVGEVTRGTTAPNRLRRLDRWLVARHGRLLRAAADPLVVDLGFGASPVTTLELASRLRAVRDDVEVVGLEIDPARVAAAAALTRAGVRFALGGFELGGLGGRRPVLVRAANVLRQYPEDGVGAAWGRMLAGLAPRGVVVDATCDEVGRRAAWVSVGADGPTGLTFSLRLAGLPAPSAVAERLPKALIHRNVPGERVHAWLAALDDAWRRSAPMAAFGARQRWLATCRLVRDDGWPVRDGPRRWRLGEVEVGWEAVRPGP